ncbi:sugar ABC transporter substrate-binding protein [halophilic archaeon]|nr:sugar ABC transporter substrate-binding protein [halophilic archaeon]
MTMDRRTVLKHVGGAAGIAALAGCTSVQENNSDGTTDSGGSSGTAKAWYSLPETEMPQRKQAIKSFNQQSSHTIKGADISEMEKKTTSTIPAGQGPKTFEWAHDWVGDYYERGFVVDQSDAVDVSLDQFIGPAREAIRYEGNLVGLPHDAETVTLIYNTDVVDSPPETVSDMVSTMEEYHAPNENKYGLSYPFDPYFTSAWLQAFGGYYFDPNEDPMLGVDKKETVRGLKFALDNFAPYMPDDAKYETQAAPFADGNAAFAINGPWYLATLNDKDVNYEVTTLPTVDGGEPKPYTGITMWYFSKSMKQGGADTKAARKFIEWYATNEDLIRKRAEKQGAIPVLDSLVGSDDLPSQVTAFSKSVDQGTPMPTHPKMNKVWPPMKTALTKAFNGDASPEAALNQAAKTIRNKWG